MGKEIAIIIPAYNAQDYISNLMYTIQAQTYIEKCKIVIINDNDNNVLYNFLYDEFSKLDIVILKTKVSQSGPGAARNIGLNYVINQKIPYIIFADADDIFYSTMAIETLYNTIKETDTDYVYSYFYQNRHGFLEINQDKIFWLFGKIYKTNIIKENNLNFPDTFIGEDWSFNLLYRLHSVKEIEIKTPLYLQVKTDNSLTNGGTSLNMENYFIKVYKVLYNTYLKVKNNSKFKIIIPEQVIYMYQNYNRLYNMLSSKNNIEQCNTLMKEMYLNIFKDFWLDYTQEDWHKAWNRVGGLNGEIPNIGFVDFLKIMTSKETDE